MRMSDSAGMRYTLRPATEEDRAFVRALHERCFHEVVVRQFGAWDAEMQKQLFNKKWDPTRYQIIVCRGADVGVLSEEQRGDHIFLAEVEIDPRVQNQGLGTQILADLFERARALKLPLRLQVLQKSRAVALYERVGFRCYGKTEKHFLMEKGWEGGEERK
jgi:GNAT superfamily N-acetyltransferase